jgi:hypothetical protein
MTETIKNSVVNIYTINYKFNSLWSETKLIHLEFTNTVQHNSDISTIFLITSIKYNVVKIYHT